MNKWENSFNKKPITQDACYCSTNAGLFIPNRQLSWAVAGVFLLISCSFTVGYFYGKKSTIEQFNEKIHQDFAADQLYTSLVTAEDIAHVAPEQKVEMTHNSVTFDTEQPVLLGDITVAAIEPVAQQEEAVIHNEATGQQFYAQLIGFGTEKAAQKFVHKLAQRNVETQIKKRSSKTANGRTMYWYQVVTPAYNDKETLTALVNQLVKEERLSGINILSC